MSKEKRLLDAQYCVEQLRAILTEVGMLAYSEAYLDGILMGLEVNDND